MKLNNKGFAITGILYGLLILFALLVGTYLTILTAKKNRLDSIITSIEEEYNESLNNRVTYTVELIKETTTLTTQEVESGKKFEFSFTELISSSYTCSVTCTESQSVSSTLNKTTRPPKRTVTIKSVTSNTVCTVKYIKSSSGGTATE
ncbi:MAG: hypothetical protein ACI310_05280 [Bacilli bacterium]